jgi:EmrB/QacA subfamily drug resistance transporter
MSTSATSPKNEQALSIKSIMLPLIAIIVGMFMVILDGTAMNVAIDQFMKDFQSSFSLVQWTITGYALAQAAVIPLAGWLSDRFGAKRIFLTSIVLFTLGSLLCGIAGSIEQLIIFRVMQGLGGGMVAPIAMAFTYRLSPPGKQGAVMGMIGIPMLLAPALGPVVSGWLVEYASWHWIFLINLPIGIIAVIVGIRTLPNLERQTVPSLDLLGMIFAPLAFAGLAYGISSAGGEHGGGNGWTAPETLFGLIGGGIALIIFIIIELKRKQPLLELRVFKSSDFTRGILLQWIVQIALFGTLFLIPVFLIQAKGFSAFETGLILLPQALSAGIGMPIGGKLFDKFGARPVVLFGLALITTGAFLLSTISASTSIPEIMLRLVLLGMGMGFSMMPLNTHIIQSAPKHLVGRVTSLTGAAQQVMSSFAIAGLSTLLADRVKHYTAVNPGPDIPYFSFGDVFFILGCVAVFGMLVALLLRRPKPQGQPDGSEAGTEQVNMMMGH